MSWKCRRCDGKAQMEGSFADDGKLLRCLSCGIVDMVDRHPPDPARVKRRTRAERQVLRIRAFEMRQDGYPWREIGEALGASTVYARECALKHRAQQNIPRALVAGRMFTYNVGGWEVRYTIGQSDNGALVVASIEIDRMALDGSSGISKNILRRLVNVPRVLQDASDEERRLRRAQEDKRRHNQPHDPHAPLAG